MSVPPAASAVQGARLTSALSPPLVKAAEPAYVSAVFASYIKRKQARGKKPEQISKKLDVLERALIGQLNQVRPNPAPLPCPAMATDSSFLRRQYPDFAAQIAQARAAFSLPTTDSSLPSAAHGSGKAGAFRDSTLTQTTVDSSP